MEGRVLTDRYGVGIEWEDEHKHEHKHEHEHDHDHDHDRTTSQPVSSRQKPPLSGNLPRMSLCIGTSSDSAMFLLTKQYLILPAISNYWWTNICEFLPSSKAVVMQVEKWAVLSGVAPEWGRCRGRVPGMKMSKVERRGGGEVRECEDWRRVGIYTDAQKVSKWAVTRARNAPRLGCTRLVLALENANLRTNGYLP
mmetsp:Transcript_4256/g.12818  ORF Transcript_4256/g.12818 Transcript_4256/m.12818 type:complete len:196 (+) Transcript_4256:333-920(+)